MGLVEDGAPSHAVKSQTESMFRRKLNDLCFAILLVKRPVTHQFKLVNGTLFAAIQFVLDLGCKRAHYK